VKLVILVNDQRSSSTISFWIRHDKVISEYFKSSCWYCLHSFRRGIYQLNLHGIRSLNSLIFGELKAQLGDSLITVCVVNALSGLAKSKEFRSLIIVNWIFCQLKLCSPRYHLSFVHYTWIICKDYQAAFHSDIEPILLYSVYGSIINLIRHLLDQYQVSERLHTLLPNVEVIVI
jgi:hypothetical protein